MNEEIKALIDSLRRGDYQDPAAKIELLVAALREGSGADLDLLLSLLRATQIPLRLAGVEACQNRPEPELIEVLVKLADDPDQRVRHKLVATIETWPDGKDIPILTKLVEDTHDEVRCSALRATVGRPHFSSLHHKLLRDDDDWEARQISAEALARQKAPASLAALFEALATDEDSDVQSACAEALETRSIAQKSLFLKHTPEDIKILGPAEKAIETLGARRYPNLLRIIRSRTASQVNPEELAQFGTDLTAQAQNNSLPRGYQVAQHCRVLRDILLQEKRRSVVLLGDSGSGKSAVVNALVYELLKPENGGWRVLRVTPSDFLTGTKYIGEWETRVKDLVNAVKRPRKVLVYIPNLEDLASVGRSSKSDSNVATALAPYIEDGTILLLGESTTSEFERGIGAIQPLQRLFEKVVLVESSIEQTRRILIDLRDNSNVTIPDQTIDCLIELSGHYLGNQCRPGNAIGLLKALLEKHAKTDPGTEVDNREVLDALSHSTGIPADLLDDTIPLQLGDVRHFFEARVMGQPEAIDAVVDLVTLIKAGLTDPNKPFGVLLLVGPTGVGKTELARALAEFIFGDTNRLQRFDMSEFASNEGFERLIGYATKPGLLTDAVRQEPFSVVLLDEIEKSHLNVFDLCLQLFDAGRLTDGRGRTVDFRRTIVILTSNIGTASPNFASMGFNPTQAPPESEPDKERTLRELHRFFRPEFLNRIDRIVNFRPLSLEVAESIARKEVTQVLQRSGILRRELMIDIDPSVLSLLVKEGYSPHFGARPLKRAVERIVLLPLGRLIASGKIAGKTVLQLTQKKGKLAVNVTAKPDPPPAPPAVAPEAPLKEAAASLLEQCAELEKQTTPLTNRKSELLETTLHPEFYKDPVARAETFDEIHKLDEFIALRKSLYNALDNFHHRVVTHPVSQAEEPSLRRRLTQLRTEMEQIRSIASCNDARDLGDILLHVSLVKRLGEQQNTVEKLARIYQGFAGRRNLTALVLAEFYNEKEDVLFVQISGLGAFSLFKSEAGLHQFDHRSQVHLPRSNKEKFRDNREVLRVDALPLGPDPDKAFLKTVKTKCHALNPPQSRILKKAGFDISVFHEPSLRSVRGWTEGSRKDALEKMHRILMTCVQAPELDEDGAAIVRQYELGSAPRVKDLRTGRSTALVERVLKGHLDLLAP